MKIEVTEEIKGVLQALVRAEETEAKLKKDFDAANEVARSTSRNLIDAIFKITLDQTLVKLRNGKVFKVVAHNQQYGYWHSRQAAHLLTNPESSLSKPWLIGVQRRKDGTFGTSRHHLYGDWELCE